MKVDELETPVVVIDLDRVERNLGRWQDYCAGHGIASRPHIKTHKVPELARRQLELGAVGISCQKLGEAETMADHGCDDILMPYNILGASKLARARALAGRIRFRASCDSSAVARGLGEAFAGAARPLEVLVECDTGAGRCGVASPAAVVELASEIDRLEGLSFAGLMTYPARGGTAAVQAFMTEAKAALGRAGLEAGIVSSGGSPDMWHAHEAPVASEYRVGTYIYYDRSLVAAGAATLDDCALRVHATVVSRPTPDRAILDAGSKSLSSDLLGLSGHGLIVEYPQAEIEKLSEEHGHVDLSHCAARPAIGERITIVPNHACVVSNLVDEVVAARGDRVERRFVVAARGRVQ
jgi:D-serine deaminase-like pyridoxal phosphate-dependent protein